MNLRVLESSDQLISAVRDSIERLSSREVSFRIAVEGPVALAVRGGRPDGVVRWGELATMDRCELILVDASELSALSPPVKAPRLFVLAPERPPDRERVEELERGVDLWVFASREVWDQLGGERRPLAREASS